MCGWALSILSIRLRSGGSGGTVGEVGGVEGRISRSRSTKWTTPVRCSGQVLLVILHLSKVSQFPPGKYQPRCGADLVGNSESVKQLRTWLSGWLGSHGRFGLSFSPLLYDLPFRRGSSSTTDLNTTASTSDTGSEWGSGSDGQEPDVERTTALITGEVLLYIVNIG